MARFATRRLFFPLLLLGFTALALFPVSESLAFPPDVAGAQVDPGAAPSNTETPDSNFWYFVFAMPFLGLLALGFTFWRAKWVAAQEVGTERMAGIAENISVGAMSFLKAEYKILSIFVIFVAVQVGNTSASTTKVRKHNK